MLKKRKKEDPDYYKGGTRQALTLFVAYLHKPTRIEKVNFFVGSIGSMLREYWRSVELLEKQVAGFTAKLGPY